MGCGSSKGSTVARGPPPTARPAAEALTIRLLDALAAKEERVSLPVHPHAQRLSSGHRGYSRSAFRGLRTFFDERGVLDKVMTDVCQEEGLQVSVCELTKSTGLSLAESLVQEVGEGEGIEELVGKATSIFSYSWTGTKLRDMLDAIERILAKLEAEDGRARFVWVRRHPHLKLPLNHTPPTPSHPIPSTASRYGHHCSARQVDMFCASQNLLAGVYRDPAVTKESDPEGYRARKEDTDRIFDDAIDAVDETFVYFEPLCSEWLAPPHPFLVAEQGKPAEGWVRQGPAALTRAWCIFELAKSLAKKCTLHVLLGTESVVQFEDTLRNNPGGHKWIGQILARVDVEQAQISKLDDREYILGEVDKLPSAVPEDREYIPGGMGAINSSVMAALRGWVIGEAQAMLEVVPFDERGTSLLLSNVATMLQEQGRLAEAEALQREQLAAWRAQGGNRHLHTLARLGNLANNLQLQGKLAEAEPLFGESVTSYREVRGNDHQNTMVTVGNLGKVLLVQGKLDEAEPLLVEAVAWARKTYGSGGPYNGALVELRREQGRLAEAEQELGTLVSDARNAVGPQHPDTLEAEAIAARLRHAQPDGKAAGAAELRAVVERMGEFLGMAHLDTIKWQRVLEEMAIASRLASRAPSMDPSRIASRAPSMDPAVLEGMAAASRIASRAPSMEPAVLEGVAPANQLASRARSMEPAILEGMAPASQLASRARTMDPGDRPQSTTHS